MTSSPGGDPSGGEVQTPPAPRAIVAGHGTFPQGIVSAVEQITGFGNVFIPLSNSGLSGEDIEGRIREHAKTSGISVFLFVLIVIK